MPVSTSPEWICPQINGLVVSAPYAGHDRSIRTCHRRLPAINDRSVLLMISKRWAPR